MRSGNQSTRCAEVHFVLAEPLAASQQVAARDPLSYRSMSHPVRLGCSSARSANPRMSILARVHRLNPRELDVDIHPGK